MNLRLTSEIEKQVGLHIKKPTQFFERACDKFFSSRNYTLLSHAHWAATARISRYNVCRIFHNRKFGLRKIKCKCFFELIEFGDLRPVE